MKLAFGILALFLASNAMAANGTSIQTQSGVVIDSSNADQLNLRDLIRLSEAGPMCFNGSADAVIETIIDRISEQKSKYKINKVKLHPMYDSIVIKYEKRSTDKKDVLAIFNCGEI